MFGSMCFIYVYNCVCVWNMIIQNNNITEDMDSTIDEEMTESERKWKIFYVYINWN